MRAYKIKSTEFTGNSPAVFVMIEGEYYGDLEYARRDNFPQNVSHWQVATCADSDRYFKVSSVQITEAQILALRKLHKTLEENNKNILDYKSGLTKADLHENRRIEEQNRPYYAKESEIKKMIYKIIESL